MSCSVFHWLTVDSADFKVGVTSLAKLLQIPSHPDHLLLLKVGHSYIVIIILNANNY